MNLQSHFGTDSRFLESDSEQEQEEINEKKTAGRKSLLQKSFLKALNVVQSILQISLSNSTSKGSVAAKKFKDIRHYDSMRHDHAAYERKKDDKLKESKAKQKNKREEAEKLPEVSKEMCCNIQFSSAQPPLCLTLCDSMNRSTPGLPESTQTHVHRVGGAIQPSHPLSSPSPPTFNLSQHQGLFKLVGSSPQVAKVSEFQLQHQSFQ